MTRAAEPGERFVERAVGLAAAFLIYDTRRADAEALKAAAGDYATRLAQLESRQAA